MAPVLSALLVHGLTGTPYEMRYLGERLAAQGIRVRGVRLAGHATAPEDLGKADPGELVRKRRARLRGTARATAIPTSSSDCHAARCSPRASPRISRKRLPGW